MLSRNAWWWTLALLVPLVVSCSAEKEPPPEDPTTYTVRGVFARVEDDGATMTVRHEDIPGYMDSMTMPFEVGDASLLEDLAYGDKIEFELAVDGSGPKVRAIRKLPQETVLSFEEE